MKNLLILFSFLSICSISYSQNVGIGTVPDASAMLDVKSDTKGMLIPRTSSNSRLAIINPAKGLILYDTTIGRFWFHNGTEWKEISDGSNQWTLTGNAATDTAINFLGTIDQQPLRLRLENVWAGELNLSTKNYFIGDSAGIATTAAGIKNVAFGSQALRQNTGSWNAAIGTNALTSNTTGNYNTAVGFLAMNANVAGSENTAIGVQALNRNIDGWYNTATGTNSLYYHKHGNGNTAHGAYALFNDTSGIENTAIGYYSLGSNKSGSWNTAVGERALLSNNSGHFNTALGNSALRFSTSAGGNTAVGVNALFYDTSGTNNTAVGVNTLLLNLKGNYNTALGYAALYNNKVDYNTAVGGYALYHDTSGTYNTSVGYGSLYLNRKGSFNTAIGMASLYSNNTGYSNTAVGYASLNLNVNGTDNVGLGDSALLNCTGSFNTAVGKKSLVNLLNGSNNIAVGNGSGNDPGSPNVVNTISIGNAGILNGATNQALIGNLSTVWNGGNRTWSTYSDARMKKNINEDVKGLDFILRLRPVTYNRSIKAIREITGNIDTKDFPGKYDIEKIKESGFLAQEVEQAGKDAGYDFSGIHKPGSGKELYSLSYEQFVVPLVKGMQEQQKIINQLKIQNELLMKRLEKLETGLAAPTQH